MEIDKQLRDNFHSSIKLYSIDRRQTIKYLSISFAVLYSYSQFYYLVFELTYFLIIPMVVNRFRCIQFSFYLELVSIRLNSINCELRKMRTTKLNDIWYHKIGLLKGLFSNIWKTAKLLNDSFSWSFLAISIELFFELTINTYLLYIALIKHNITVFILLVYYLCILPTLFSFLLCCQNAGRCTDMVFIDLKLASTDFNNIILVP